MSDAFPEISPKGAYVSTDNFATEIYSYTVSLNANLETVGTLANITRLPDNVTVLIGSSYACPANRILNLTGKKLLPGRDVITVNTTSPATTATFFVGVLDPVTGLNGFIDPTSKTFARYTNDAIVINDGTRPFNANQTFGGPLPGGVGSKLIISPTANVGGANAAIATTANGGTLAAGSASVGRVQFNGSAGSIIVNTTAVTPSSLIFITPMGQPGTLWVRYVGTGSFSIHTTNVTESCAVNWMIVN